MQSIWNIGHLGSICFKPFVQYIFFVLRKAAFDFLHLLHSFPSYVEIIYMHDLESEVYTPWNPTSVYCITLKPGPEWPLEKGKQWYTHHGYMICPWFTDPNLVFQKVQLPCCRHYQSKIQSPLYNIRSTCNQIRIGNVKTVHCGLNPVRYPGPKICELVPNNIKYSNSLSKFNKLIKSWKREACPCRLRKRCITQVGFIYLMIYKYFTSHV